MLYTIHQQEKTNSKYIKEYDTDKELSCIMYWDISNLYGWVMSQNLPVGGFDWQYERDFDEDYIRNYNTILKSMLSISKSYTSYTICYSHSKEWNFTSVKKNRVYSDQQKNIIYTEKPWSRYWIMDLCSSSSIKKHR